MSIDQCISCGKVVPEGLGVCPSCQRGGAPAQRHQAVKAWLSRGWHLSELICQLQEARQRAADLVTRTTPHYGGDKVQTGGGNAMADKMAAYASYCLLIDQKLAQLYAVQQEILAAIQQVDDPVLRCLLTARYINCKTWEQVATESSYSWRQVHNQHHKALALLAPSLPLI